MGVFGYHHFYFRGFLKSYDWCRFRSAATRKMMLSCLWTFKPCTGNSESWLCNIQWAQIGLNSQGSCSKHSDFKQGESEASHCDSSLTQPWSNQRGGSLASEKRRPRGEHSTLLAPGSQDGTAVGGISFLTNVPATWLNFPVWENSLRVLLFIVTTGSRKSEN